MNAPSHGTNRARCQHVKGLLGRLPLAEVTRVRIMEYKPRRLAEPLTRHGKPVKGSQVQGATVNREISCLVGALNLACDQGLCDGAPKGQEGARDRA